MNEESSIDTDLEKEYRRIQPIYLSLSETVKNILKHAIPNDVSVHSIEFRAKKVESFLNKAVKHDESDINKPKYEDPLSQITDLAGIRVIVFFPKSLERIGDAIRDEFDVTWMKDIGEERFAEGKFGYQSIHYLVKIPEEKTKWAEYRDFDGLIAEIQVRTILQHAWAEMEHDIQYKSTEQIPSSIQRRFLALAGIIEIADREFQSIQDEDSKIHLTVSSSLQDDLIETTEASILQGDSAGVDRISPDLIPKAARTLIAERNYADAIEHYSNLITQEPESYTLYIGRAKARFLQGDRPGAIEDLGCAEKLQPNDMVIGKLRSQIKEGVLDNTNTAAEAWQLSTSANKVLAKGDGEQAFKMYSQAQALGFNPFFSTFNKAMACTLNKDADIANYFLGQYAPTKDSPSEINALALRAISAHIGKTG